MPENRLKIAQIITGLGTGGAERLLLNLCNKFDGKKFESCIISLSSDKSAISVYGHENTQTEIAIFDLGGSRKIGNFRSFLKYLAEFEPDIIHAHMFHALIAALLAKPFLPTKPAICFTSHLNPYPRLRAGIVKATRRFRAFDIIFRPGQHVDINTASTVVIPNGVPFNPAPDRRAWRAGETLRLLAVGRIADQKDPIGMIEAFIAAGLPHATLEFVGTGPLLDEALALVGRHNMNDRIVFHGLRSDTDRFMHDADVLVMHSKYEGMPMSLLEAAALAMPIISTPVGAAVGILGEGRGYVSHPADFARTLRHVAGNSSEAVASGRRLYEYAAQRFSLEKVAAQHEDVYSRAAHTDR